MIPIAFSIIAPYGEIIAMSHSTNTSWQPEYNRIIVIFGKPAMAEQMYLAVYITLAKRIGVVLNQFPEIYACLQLAYSHLSGSV